MAVSINKYGYAVDENGRNIGVAKRADGESREQYLARAQERVNYDAGGGTDKSYKPIAPTENWKAGGSWASPSPAVKQPIVPLQPQFDIQAEIEKLRKAQTDAAVASLGKARDQSLSNLDREKAQIEPTYYAKRNSASTQSQLGAKNFAEFMAGRGGTTAGSNMQAELSRGGALQGELGSLGRDEANAFVENSRRVSDVGNAYNSDVAAAEAGAMATSLQNTINQMNMDRQFNQASEQFAKNFGLQEAGLTGVYNNAPTMAAKQYQSGLDQWQQQFDYGKSRDTVADSQWGKTFDANQAAREFEQWLQQQNLSLSKQNAARSSSGGGGSSSTNLSALKYQNELGSQQAFATAMQGLQQKASDGATRSEILKFINSNAGDLQANGVPVQDLYNWATKNFLWDKDSSGDWYDTTAQ